MKSCVAVLTRGYEDFDKYSMLISRNKHISANLNDKSVDILIFHEGNITVDQQKYIKGETNDLNLKFINVSGLAFRAEKQNVEFEEAHFFNLGYRHMCSFWFVDFWNFVKDYDKLLRIDEDCFIDFNVDTIFSKLNETIFITGQTVGDEACVTKGLNAFSIDFINKNKGSFTFKNYDKRNPGGPLTSIFGLSLNKIRKYDILQKYVSEIDESNMIYKRRWGDLPLWGEAICYIFGYGSRKVDSSIKYYHASHEAQIN